jgi:hypothetical protein
MATPAQLTANRTTTHGLSGHQLAVKGEDPAAYDTLRAELHAHYAPANIAESLMVDQVAQNQWRLERSRRVEALLTAELGELAIFVEEKAIKKYANFMRHRNSIERAWRYALRELESLQATRAKQQAAAHKVESIRTYIAARPTIGSVLQKAEDSNSADACYNQLLR